MRARGTVRLLALALLLVGASVPLVAATSAPQSPSTTAAALAVVVKPTPPVHLPGRTLQVAPIVGGATPGGGSPGRPASHQVSLAVTLTNTGAQPFSMRRGDFRVIAEGDIFQSDPTTTTFGDQVAPGATDTRQVDFTLPDPALPEAALLYSPGDQPFATVPLGLSTTTTPTGTGGGGSGAALPATASTPNVVEDDFARADQAGWGTATNSDGVAAVAWGVDGAGSLANVQISGDRGVYGYPGAINQVGIASAGATARDGGDALGELTLSAVGHATAYIALDACADKSCYYGARLNTAAGHLELARRSGNNTTVLAWVAFAPTAGTAYWLRLDVAPGSPTTLRAKVWAAGTAEPATWMVSASDATPLAANLATAGGSWSQAGTGESIAYACYAYAPAGSTAAPCDASGGTPTPTPTGTPTNTPTATPTGTPLPTNLSTVGITGGAGDPWGTATDAAGNVWFAEPGCDFGPTCQGTPPPGQLGMIAAGNHAITLYPLPSGTGNQPLFVALDKSGNVWFTMPNNDEIGEFTPSTKQFNMWSVGSSVGPWDLAIDANGMVWYTDHLAQQVGMFNPSTHTHTDFQTPSANSNPYGIVIDANGKVWFTENNSAVARIGVIDTANGDNISEYQIRANPPGGQFGLTPHLLTLDGQGHPWWTEGWVRAIGTLDPATATAGTCGGTGECAGVTEYQVTAASSCNSGAHISGIAWRDGSTVWLDDSLGAQVFAFDQGSHQFTTYNLTTCGVHPHDGLNLDPSHDVWWDEEFANALVELH